MSILNVRELDPPTQSCQFDVNCGKIRGKFSLTYNALCSVILRYILFFFQSDSTVCCRLPFSCDNINQINVYPILYYIHHPWHEFQILQSFLLPFLFYFSTVDSQRLNNQKLSFYQSTVIINFSLYWFVTVDSHRSNS